MHEVIADVAGNLIPVDVSVSAGEAIPVEVGGGSGGGGGGGGNVQASKAVSYTPSETAISDTVQPDEGYDSMAEVAVSVGAIPDDYVGSSIDRNDSTDMMISENNPPTVLAPAGYYANDATLNVPAGTAGNPSAQKGAVSNHAVQVTPKVTNSAGWIAGGTKSGTPVTVEASELVSGNKAITENGDNIDVTEYATVSVNVSGGGAQPSLEDDVVFIDYDGTPLYSYTKAEFALLDSLPANPSHTGLTAEGWNWTLADAKSYVADMDGLVIGQNYITDDGKTRLYVTMEAPDLTFTVRFWADSSGKVDIDWGDGNTETPTGTGAKNVSHTYASEGDYVVTLYPTSGNLHCNGSIMSAYSTGVAQKRIRKVEIGKNFMFGGDTFRSCRRLESASISKTATAQSGMFGSNFRDCWPLKALVFPSGWEHGFSGVCYESKGLEVFSMPNGVTTISGQSFYGCYALRRLHIPKTATSMTGSAYMSSNFAMKKLVLPPNMTSISQLMSGAQFLQDVVLPENLETIGANMAMNAYMLDHVTIPSKVTSIGAAAFQNIAMRELHLKPATPPTLANTNAFNFSTGAVIYVPQGKLATYQGESGWSTWASYMVEESS